MSIKRTIITTILAIAMVVTVAPAPAQADTLSDLMAQIAALQAQIAALQGGATPVPTGIVACSGVTFNRTLTVGSTGQDVKCLQVLMNTNGYTLAATGAGSPGMETSYFGPATLAAVRAFQASKGWVPANQVGPLTMAALNALITATPPVPPTPPVAGCPAGAIYNSITGAPCATAPATPGAVGFLSIPSLAPTPASNANITATSNVPVLGVNIKAIGSNMNVGSAKVQLAITGGDYPSTVVQNLYVYDGSTLLGTFPVNTNTVIKNGADYYVILSGFNFMVPVNTTKTLTVNADFTPGLETSRTVTINLYGTDAVRGTDGAGAFTTATVTGSRVYTIAYATVGNSTLTVSANTATPKSSSVSVNATSGRTDVPMLAFDARSTTGASTITDIKFTAQGTSLAIASLTAVKLYDGSTLLGSQSLSSGSSGATAAFADLAVVVAKDTTKPLTVKADFGAGVTNSSNVSLSILTTASDVTYQQPDLTATTATGTAAGNAMYLFGEKTAALTFTSATSSYSYNSSIPTNSYTTGVITFKVKADGGTMTALTNASGASPIKVKWNSTILTGGNVNVDFTPVGGTSGDNLSDGGEAIVTVTMTVPQTTSGTGFVNFNIYEINWTVGGVSAVQTWGLGDFKTPVVNVQ